MATDIRVRCGLTTTYASSYSGVTSNGVDRIYIGNRTNAVIYVLDASFAYLATISQPNAASPFVERMCYDRLMDNIYMLATSNYYTYKFPVATISPGAQNLLAAPVTKTATNTMKIQYDFQIQKVL